MYIQRPINEYLDDLAAKKPAPGGGSASAFAGALAAALLSMVANFTAGKEKYRSVEQDIQRILSGSERLRQGLTKLVDEDVLAYQRYAEASKSKDQKEVRKALRSAAKVPLEVCALCLEGLTVAAELVDKGNANLISDVGVAAEIFAAAYESAKMNVDINLKYLGDDPFISTARKTFESNGARVVSMKKEIVEKVRRHIQ